MCVARTYGSCQLSLRVHHCAHGGNGVLAGMHEQATAAAGTGAESTARRKRRTSEIVDGDGHGHGMLVL